MDAITAAIIFAENAKSSAAKLKDNGGLARGTDGLYVDTDVIQSRAVSRTVTISVADWNGGTSCVKSVTGVTADSIVLCDSSDASVKCTAQGSGTLTFTATATPTAAVTVKAVIL